MTFLFWASIVIAGYIYAGYPALLAAWARLAERPVRKRMPASSGPWPAVSIVLAARNEAPRLAARIQNLLDQDYPGELEIIVASGASSDDTPRVVARFGGRVRLVELSEPGKPRALNAGVAAAAGEILVFADARQQFAPDAVRHLVANFSDPEVGGATGELVLQQAPSPDAGSDSAIGESVGLYWNYEKWLRRRESRIGSTLGATGAIYALRRSLWQPLPPETLLDDVLAPMQAVLAGYRIVFDDEALAFDHPERDSETESRRKTRTLAGNYQILLLEPRLLVPIVNPVWFQYLSHKVGRLVVPWCLLGAFISSAALAPTSLFYATVFLGQLGFYGLALFGAWTERRELSGTDRATSQAARLQTTRSAPPASPTKQVFAERR